MYIPNPMEDDTMTPEACPKCRTVLSQGMRFCNTCGLPLGKAHSPNAVAPVLGWAVAGAAAVALIMVVLTRYGGPTEQPATPAPRPGPVAAPDISQMTPRERADRLFDRIVDAAERGDTAQITMFQPMALAAYDMLDERDADARYHIGVIHSLVGNPAGARAQLDSLRGTEPTHLLGVMLDYTIARIELDVTAQQSTYRRFVDTYDSEITKPQPEYEAHKAAIDAFLVAARRALSENN